MRFEPRKHLPRTLRFRLTFWNTVAILILVSGALWGVREGLRIALLKELDAQLAEDAEEVKLNLDAVWPKLEQLKDELRPKVVSHKVRGWYVRVYSMDYKMLWASDGAPELNAPPIEDLRSGPFSWKNYRLVQHPIEAGKHSPALIVRVGVQRDQVDEDIWRLTEMMLTAFALILVAAPLIGYLLAGRAIRPLATILQTTARLHPDNLSERLPLRGSGDELDQLSATMNGMLDRIATHLEQQRTFVANAAHELRSPLTAMRTALEVTLDRERSPAEYRDLCSDLVEECTSLGNLINHLLLLAEGDAGLLQADDEVRLDMLVQRAADMFEGIAEQRDVSLQVKADQPVTIRGNRVHLREVIHNLLDNALKFTQQGGMVSLELRSSPGSSDVQLRVRDTGSGISPEDLPKVFERFYRADKSRQRDRAARGSGLGLSICRSIIHSYGGQISLESILGKGTTVTVSLPISGPSPTLAQPV